jgi:uncharacterized membrane protein required for colicin V production
MSDLSVTFVDLVVVAVIAISTIFAIYRGFVAESLSVFAWVAAAFASLYFGHAVVPLMAGHFSPLAAKIVAYAAVFLVVLIPLSFISYRFAGAVQNSPVHAIDRSLGGAFGVLRGLAIVGLAYLLFSMVVPVRAQPGWVSHARLLPLIQSSSDVLLSLVPGKGPKMAKADEAPVAAANSESGPTPRPRPAHGKTPAHSRKAGHKGYGAEDRRALDRLFEATGSGSEKKP